MRSSQAETDIPITDTLECKDRSVVGSCIENANGCNLPKHLLYKCTAGLESDES
jgi:hypothetical protein